MTNFPVFVLDSFTLLAYLTDEPSAAQIETLIEEAKQNMRRLLMSIINLGEILYITERRGDMDKAQDTLALIQQLPIKIAAADEKSVFAAAHIKANYAISYADAFVVALAQQETGTILTGDPEFQAVKELVTIEWL